MKRAPDNVRYLGQFGEVILTRSFTARDPNRTQQKLCHRCGGRREDESRLSFGANESVPEKLGLLLSSSPIISEQRSGRWGRLFSPKRIGDHQRVAIGPRIPDGGNRDVVNPVLVPAAFVVDHEHRVNIGEQADERARIVWVTAQNRAVRRTDRQPSEGRELSWRHCRAQRGSGGHSRGPDSQDNRSAGDILAACA
jgi:hypothetical protein